MAKFELFFLTWVFSVYSMVYCDTPANCTYEDILGDWIFHEGNRNSNSSINCTDFSVSGPHVHTIRLRLDFPNLAVDDEGNKGFWTLVYNQGFEVVINYRKYFAFSNYSQDGETSVSFCDSVMPGWSHDVLGKNWACYNGIKTQPQPPKVNQIVPPLTQYYKQRKSFVRRINRVQSLWTATVYTELFGFTIEEMLRRSGGRKSEIPDFPPLKEATRLQQLQASMLPEEFDWRNVDGRSFVSPVRNQGSCGSCYAFSSLAMLESRLRIATNGTIQVQLSPQDVVSCSEYSQGCEGGFPYLIAGKYAQDFGVVPETCSPYKGGDSPCSTRKQCKRYYVADYSYIGGFYGGCNEELMRLDLVNNGPLTVAFEVYEDFQFYAGGIYHHTGVTEGFNPFQILNHGVLIVGYGQDKNTREKYWSVKNSWGEEWGENGFFRIRRGSNECNIESLAVSAIPIP